MTRIGPRFWYGVAALAASVTAWEGLSRAVVFNPVLLPSPSAVLPALASAYERGELQADVLSSLHRVAVGYLIGTGLGIAVGAVFLFRRARWVLSPVLELLRPIPPLAWIPLAILWFGYGNAAAYYLVALGAFFPALSGTHHGFARVEVGYLNASRVLGFSPWRTFIFVTVPQAAGATFNGAKIGLGVSWMIVITCELVGGIQSGLGYRIQVCRAQLQTEQVIGCMMVIGVIGYVLLKGIALLERLVLPWRFRGRELELE
jgi:NitT/TauT family transport system permease protein